MCGSKLKIIKINIEKEVKIKDFLGRYCGLLTIKMTQRMTIKVTRILKAKAFPVINGKSKESTTTKEMKGVKYIRKNKTFSSFSFSSMKEL